MTKRTWIEITRNLSADALTILGIPASTAADLFRRYLNTKMNDAFTILLDELRTGDIDVSHVANENEAIAICYRYILAVRDGAARRNLRLLAKAMVGLARRDQLFSDNFNKYADVLTRLTRDQIVVLGRFYALYESEIKDQQDLEQARSNAWTQMEQELVPTEFPSKDHIVYVCSQAMGLGLLVGVGVYGGLAFRISPLMEEVAALADFQDVLRSEYGMQDSS